MTNQLIEEKIKDILLKIHNVYATIFQLSGYNDDQLKEKKDVIKDFLKTSLNEVVEATNKEWEEKYRKYRDSCLDELEELGYNKDAIKRREKEILEGIEKLSEKQMSGYGHHFSIPLEDIKKIINKTLAR